MCVYVSLRQNTDEKKNLQVFVYYESIKWDLNIKLISECRCDERLKTKVEESTRLTHTGLIGELEHLKIKMRLMNEKFVSVKIKMRLIDEKFELCHWVVKKKSRGGNGTGHGHVAQDELLVFILCCRTEGLFISNWKKIRCKLVVDEIVVYYETIKRDLKIKPISECWCMKTEVGSCCGCFCLFYNSVYYESSKWEIKTKPIYETTLWVSVWWNPKNLRWEIYTTRIHWVDRGTGTPKDKDEVNRGDVCECDGWVCVFKVVVYYESIKRKVKTKIF